MRILKISLLSAIIFLIKIPLIGQSLDILWSFETGAKVLASPALADGKVYIGTEDGDFFALEEKSGTQIWKIQTDGNIQSKALVTDVNVFFESANMYYALDKEDGKILWQFDPN